MIIITEKPARSIEVKGWYIDSYKDKSDKTIYKVVGVVSTKCRGRIASRDSEVVKDVYMDEETITIYRNENYNNVLACKRIMDVSASRNVPVFSLEVFYDWLRNNSVKPEEEAVTINEN